MKHILAVSGSLRARSSNTELLKAALLLAPPDVRITLLTGLAEVPPFNPDHDVDPAPAAVSLLRAQFAASDALLFCTPEYAHGVPGVLKNALDWLVASGETSQKPVALWNASPRSTYAQAALREIVSTMDAPVIDPACADFSLPRGSVLLDAAAIAADPHFSSTIRAALIAFLTAM